MTGIDGMVDLLTGERKARTAANKPPSDPCQTAVAVVAGEIVAPPVGRP